jgi:ATP-dependent Clp endopeptidase proteolytic subunit ClpP
MTSSSDEAGAVTLPVYRRANKIYLYGDIDLESCAILRDALSDVEDDNLQVQKMFSLSEAPPVELHVQSRGGTVMHGLAMVDFVQSLKCPVYSYVDGFAASAATLITVSCDKRFAYPHSLMLLHQLSGGAEGKLEEVKEAVDNMNTMMDVIKDIYSKHTNLGNRELDLMLKRDKWLSSDECLAMGLVDDIVGSFRSPTKSSLAPASHGHNGVASSTMIDPSLQEL